MDEQGLKRTPLHEEHIAAGARLVPFAGWEMPVQYEGVKQEHLAVRSGCGIFDVSHMGEIATSGPEAEAFLQRLLSNDVAAMPVGGAQYSCLCEEERGGILDDLFTYRLGPDSYLTVTNAANHAGDLARFRSIAEDFDAEVRDVHSDWAMIAVQGPTARGIVSSMAAGELPQRMRAGEVEVAGVRALVCGTGYTGEAGVELMCRPEDAVALWRALADAGALPAGLGARDTLRLEVCFPLHGNEISPERNPIEAGLGWCCKEPTGFLGSDAVARAREEGTAERLIAFLLTDRGIPRDGNALLVDGERVGVVTSGTFAPTLQAGAGMGYVRADLAEPGTRLDVDVRGKLRPAEVKPMPLHEKQK